MEEKKKGKIFGKEKNSFPKKDFKKQSQEYLNGWKRCQADFENYKKRQAESQKDIIKYSTENIVTQILPVLDNFQAATEHIPEEQKDSAWVQGITHIQKQLETVLADNGVEEIKIKAGNNFNPEIHEAIAERTTNNEQSASPAGKRTMNKSVIKKIILRGYKIGDKIIRPARVTLE
ncbi:nucleotide exchange factor GrpE [bacterium]|nr:nucleotide exchange factor GrpE [bacterium]